MRPAPPSPSSATPVSPRRRRLRATIVLLTGFVLLGLALGLMIYFKTRPAPYRPDEQAADITSELARNLPRETPRPNFQDVTREAGLAGFRNFAGTRTSQMPEDVGPGLAWGDFDNDGDDDLFVVSAGGGLNLPAEKLLPCALYENLGRGTFRRVQTFPDTRIHGMAAAWGDYDGDGFLDLVVTGYNALRLFHNEAGTGHFTRDDRLPDRKGFWSGASWGDYDNDRALDLYVCGYVQYVENEVDIPRDSSQQGTFVPFTLNPSSYPGGTNLLFHNTGGGVFTEVGATLQVQNPEGRSLGALWHDFDEDGWLDLYVANDVSDNVFYHNTGGKFEEISHSALVADYRSAMGLAAGDYDRDGDDDLFISHWVAQENALYENLWADFNLKPRPSNATRVSEQKQSPKCDLRVEPGANPSAGEVNTRSSIAARAVPYPLRFMDIADRKGLGQIALPFVGWGTEFADFDGDGWLDLVVVNGNTLEFDGPMPRKLKPQEAMLFWNQRGEFFFNLAPLSKVLSEPHHSRGLALADYDDDGDLDMAIAQLGEGVQLLRNDMQSGHWLRVRLRSLNAGGQPLGFGDGTTVIAHVAGASLRRAVSSVSYLSQSSRTLHFGLGPAAQVDRLEVRWHAGPTNFFENLQANATFQITEGDATARSVVRRSSEIQESNASPAAQSRAASSSELNKREVPNDQKQRLLDFWKKQRAAMNAMKVEKDNIKASALFREALILDPSHEDSRYYLAFCLASQGDAEGALAQLQELKRLNPQSHRAWQQWGVLRAASARSDADLATAEESLERAHELNPEETGALLVLGEISLLRHDPARAEERLAAACRTNPKAVGGFFLRAYLAWSRGDVAGAKKLLEDARAALGKDWQPKGATSEGDVQRKHHVEGTPLTRFWEAWDGAPEPARSFAALEKSLQRSAGP